MTRQLEGMELHVTGNTCRKFKQIFCLYLLLKSISFKNNDGNLHSTIFFMNGELNCSYLDVYFTYERKSERCTAIAYYLKNK